MKKEPADCLDLNLDPWINSSDRLFSSLIIHYVFYIFISQCPKSPKYLRIHYRWTFFNSFLKVELFVISVITTTLTVIDLQSSD